ncbi:MAG TPA: hypothetical protein VE868_09535 [Balneolaceae bacterium]|nr:hypothetical protein [Balneolaceae bacterium]
MSSKKKDIEEELENKADELRAKGVEGYEKIIDRLYEQRDNIRKELDSDYNEARRYVRSNPEEGILLGLAAGFAIGILLGRLVK